MVQQGQDWRIDVVIELFSGFLCMGVAVPVKQVEDMARIDGKKPEHDETWIACMICNIYFKMILPLNWFEVENDDIV